MHSSNTEHGYETSFCNMKNRILGIWKEHRPCSHTDLGSNSEVGTIFPILYIRKMELEDITYLDSHNLVVEFEPKSV